MLLNYFDTKEATQIGINLADDFSRQFAKINKKHSKNENLSGIKLVENLLLHFGGFDRIAKLNFYKKSKLVNEFRWRLLELEHEKELVEVMVKELVIYINR